MEKAGELLFIALVLVPLWGCEEESSRALARYELSGVEVLSYEHPQLCRGLLDMIESENHRIARTLQAPLDHPVLVAYGTSAVEELCSDGAGGCALASGPPFWAVADDFVAMRHELVHANRHGNPGTRKSPFLEEGLALSLTAGPYGSSTSDSARTRDLAEAFALPQSEVDFWVAREGGHLVSWLRLRFGTPAVVAMYNDEDDEDLDALFQRHFGYNLIDLRQVWFDETETRIRIGEACVRRPTYILSQNRITIEADTRCDAPDVFGPKGAAGNGTPVERRYCFEIAQTRRARITVESDTGLSVIKLFRTGLDCPPAELGGLAASDKLVEEGTTEVDFTECLWAGVIRTDADETESVRVTITPLP